MASIETVREAAGRIKPYAHRTPVLTSRTVDLECGEGRRIFFKCEPFQRVGAFKFRGATNAVFKLTNQEASKGVVTHSSGNHAQALALAAKLRGIPAYVVMPNNAPEIKKRAVRGYGAQVVECVPTLIAREQTANEIIAKTGATFIHPYNNYDVISGQGTATLELISQVAELGGDEIDCFIVPVGGGGLLSGACITAKAINPNTKIIAAEPAGADDCKRSFEAKKLIPINQTNTIADGLLTSLGDKTWPIIRDNVHTVITVSEDEIISAMKFFWERMKVTIEPSSAVAVAVLFTKEFRAIPNVRTIGVILSGGNVELTKLPFRL